MYHRFVSLNTVQFQHRLFIISEQCYISTTHTVLHATSQIEYACREAAPCILCPITVSLQDPQGRALCSWLWVGTTRHSSTSRLKPTNCIYGGPPTTQPTRKDSRYATQVQTICFCSLLTSVCLLVRLIKYQLTFHKSSKIWRMCLYYFCVINSLLFFHIEHECQCALYPCSDLKTKIDESVIFDGGEGNKCPTMSGRCSTVSSGFRLLQNFFATFCWKFSSVNELHLFFSSWKWI